MKLRDVFVQEAHARGITVYEDWDAELEIWRNGRELLSPRTVMRLKVFKALAQKHSNAGKFLKNGRSEVSVFWTDEYGHRYKARFDYLRVKTVADLKSYAVRHGSGAIDTFVGAIDTFAYDFSAAWYMDCRTTVLPKLVAEGKVYRPHPTHLNSGEDYVAIDPASEDMEFFRKVAAFENPVWVWITCATGGYPEVDAIEFPTDTLRYSAAQFQVADAKRRYREFYEKFGEDPTVPWIEDRKLVRLTDFNLSSQRATNRGAIMWESV